MKDLKQIISNILKPVENELFKDILWYNGTFQSCGYAASIITNILQKKLPNDNVRIGLGYKGSEKELKYHFFTEVNNSIFVDITYTQYLPVTDKFILIEDIKKIKKFNLTRMDRNHPKKFSRLIVERCGKQTFIDLIEKPDDPFIPGFNSICKREKREYTLNVIKKLLQKLEI